MQDKKLKIETKDAMTAAVAEIASITVDANCLEARMDAELIAIRKRFAERIEEKRRQLKALTAACRKWAVKNKAEFGDAKSIDFGLAVVGFRTGMPKLTFAEGFDEERTIAAILENFPKSDYVTTVDVLNKAAIIADRDDLTDDDLFQIGVSVEQSESFFVEVKLDEPERVKIEK